MNKQFEIYTNWYKAYIDHPERDKHFANIASCIRQDIEHGVIKKNSKTHQDLRDWVQGFTSSLPPIDSNKTQIEQLADAAGLVFEDSKFL